MPNIPDTEFTLRELEILFEITSDSVTYTSMGSIRIRSGEDYIPPEEVRELKRKLATRHAELSALLN